MKQLINGPITPEREAFNAALVKFAHTVPTSARVYDIGKSHVWSYRGTFMDHDYHVVDRCPELKPDLCIDLESFASVHSEEKCDAMICNGCTEQCGDPFNLITGARELCRSGALSLWGAAGPGYPEYGSRDRFRFTPHGLVDALSSRGFDVTSVTSIRRGSLTSYMLITCTAQ